MTNVILTVILAAIVGGAGLYIYRAKKRGVHCIGCPDAKACAAGKASGCSGSCSGCSGCSGCSSGQRP